MLIQGNKKSKKSDFLNKLPITLLGFFLGMLATITFLNFSLIYQQANKGYQSAKNKILGKTLELPKVYLDIEHEPRMKILYQRENALEQHFNISSAQDYVNAKIRDEEENQDIKIKLKGATQEHYIDPNKLSYKIKVLKRNTFRGKKFFSLVSPKTRSYVYEWVFNQALKRENLLYNEVSFVNLFVNGENKGIYLLEEDTGKRLLESKNNRAGPIVKLDKVLFLSEWNKEIEQIKKQDSSKKQIGYMPKRIVGGLHSRTTSVAHFKEYLDSPQDKKQAEYAITKMQDFIENKASVEQTFDLEKLAKYLAIKILLGSSEFDPNDSNFYLNPISNKFEPIGSELNSAFSTKTKFQTGAWWINDPEKLDPFVRRDFLNLFFKDNTFWQHYIKALEQVSKQDYSDKLISSIKEQHTKIVNTLSTEFEDFNPSLERVKTKQHIIRETLNPVKTSHVYILAHDSKSITLNIANLQSIPLVTRDIVFNNTRLKCEPLTLTAHSKKEFPKYSSTKCSHQNLINIDNIRDLKLETNLIGTETIQKIAIFPWSNKKSDSFSSSELLVSFKNFPFITYSEQEKECYIQTGTWDITTDLVFPAGYKIFANEGTVLNLGNKALIKSDSPFLFKGTKHNPIIINGGSVFINQAKQTSRLEHVIFKNLIAPIKGAWQLPAAVTFYKTSVNLKNVQFQNINSEDALNIVDSKYYIENSNFNTVLSDAFDSDFSTGVVKNSTFYNIGNDSIDFSGSSSILENIKIINSKEKGISIGEASNVNARNISITTSPLGLACKDGSILNANNFSFKDTKVAIASFRKKPEYGIAKAKIENYKLENVEKPFLKDKKSILLLDNKKDKVVIKKDIYDWLYKK